jgi:hypothetical protein
MVAWVGQGGVSVSVTVGQRPGGMVGWVPLAPREIYYPSYTTSVTYIQNVNIYRGRVPDRREPRPGQPVMYTNRGVPGGVTMVSADVLAQRQPVNRYVRPVEPQGRGGRADEWRGLTTTSAPPAMGAIGGAGPAGAGRVVREPGDRPGQRPGAPADLRPEGRPLDRPGERPGQRPGTSPGNANWTTERQPNNGAPGLSTTPAAQLPQPMTPVERPRGNIGRPGMSGPQEGEDRPSQRPMPVPRTAVPVAPVAPAAQMPPPMVRPQPPQPQPQPQMVPQRERPQPQEDRRERNGKVERPDRNRGELRRDPNQVN